MSKELTDMQLRMAALGNNMKEAGAEFYRNPRVREEIKKNIRNEKVQGMHTEEKMHK